MLTKKSKISSSRGHREKEFVVPMFDFQKFYVAPVMPTAQHDPARRQTAPGIAIINPGLCGCVVGSECMDVCVARPV